MLQRYFGLHGSSRAWLIAKLQKQFAQVCIICRTSQSAQELVEDLSFFVGRNVEVFHFPAWDSLPFELVSPQPYISAARMKILTCLNERRPCIVAAAPDAMSQKVLPAQVISRLSFNLQVNCEYQQDFLLDQFDHSGYRQVSLVEETADLAVRGGVVDFFPGDSSQPIRLEFAGDRLVDIRCFEVDSQRSLQTLTRWTVLPVREAVNFNPGAPFHDLLSAAISALKDRARLLETPPREVAKVLTALKEGQDFPAMELATAIAFNQFELLIDQLAPQAALVVDDELLVNEALDAFAHLVDARQQRLAGEHYLIPSLEQLYADPTVLAAAIESFPNRVYLDQLEVLDGAEQSVNSINCATLSNIELVTRLDSSRGTGHALQPLKLAVDRWRSSGCSIAFVVGSEQRLQRLQRELLSIDLDAELLPWSGRQWTESAKRPALVVLEGDLREGFQLPKEKLVFISESDLFARRSHRKHREASARSIRKLMSTLSNLHADNYVVHEDYGVGTYHGLVQLEVEGVIGDFMYIEYADSTLYLPVQQIGKIQKYSAAEGQIPNLDRLGSRRWIKTKAKIRESVAALAGDLMKLYASRSQAVGWRYDPEGAADERFADDFPYDETPDQLAAIKDTLTDLANEKPADRLICGDVGFGKTEVALRAAYKVLQHARQTAILVPTTILAEQHYRTFTARFQEYSAAIGIVSRFYSGRENLETLQKLAQGDIDIIIGTHRLLQRDVQFRDLGLLIIDEEHRFGVQQKEKLKQLKRQVDVLTLTATPIPRTLHMGLLGIRDVSVISSPPQDRRLIKTYVATRSDAVIRDALLREHQRGGQSFFLHNRVQSIGSISAALAELVPEVRLEFAHGQMTEGLLEGIMRRFLNREIDVLVSTTIIESGVDIPNVNTIVIDRAHQFGLAQLYQLRGRVGRSDRQAYAYLLIPPARRLGAEAQARLKVLQSLDDLGQGFNLALRDLEIRGVGNLLGREQSGHVHAIGFELYTKILKEAVLNLKGEDFELEEIIDPEVKLGVSAYIPEAYIPDIAERLVLYQRLAGIASAAEATELSEEIRDRFGHPPEEVEHLLTVMELRGLLRACGVVKADYHHPSFSLFFSPKARIDAASLLALVKTEPHKYKLGRSLALTVTISGVERQEPSQLLCVAQRLLESVRQT